MKPLLFCHIPKCGGTSLRSVIETEYQEKERVFLYNGELSLKGQNTQFLEQFRQIRDVIRIIYGHFSFGVHRFIGVHPYYATIVREPVARIVSLHNHFSRDFSSPFFHSINSGLSLKQFVYNRYTEMTNNHMTRMLAGLPPQTGIIIIVYSNECLEQAKQNVEKYFCVVGTVEAIQDAVRVLGKRLGWRCHTVAHLNVTVGSRIELDKDTCDVIYEYNKLDFLLYDWISKNGNRTFKQ